MKIPALLAPASTATRAMIALALCTAVAGLCLATGSPGGTDAASQPGLALALPAELGAWSGSPGEVSRAEKEILPEDTEFAKMNYSRGHGPWQERVLCSIVLSGKDRTSIHRPEVCLVGQGWNIDASTERLVELRNGSGLAVRRLELSREVDGQDRRALYYYWFVSNTATTADHLDRILLTAKDNILHNRNPRWAYVSVLAAVSGDQRRHGGQSIDEATNMLEDFISRSTPEFQTSFEPAGLF